MPPIGAVRHQTVNQKSVHLIGCSYIEVLVPCIKLFLKYHKCL